MVLRTENNKDRYKNWYVVNKIYFHGFTLNNFTETNRVLKKINFQIQSVKYDSPLQRVSQHSEKYFNLFYYCKLG